MMDLLQPEPAPHLDRDLLMDSLSDIRLSHSNSAANMSDVDMSPHSSRHRSHHSPSHSRSRSHSASPPPHAHDSPSLSPEPDPEPYIPSIAERVSRLAMNGMDLDVRRNKIHTHVRRSTVRISRHVKPAIKSGSVRHRRSRSTTLPMHVLIENSEEDIIPHQRDRTASVDVDGEEEISMIQRRRASSSASHASQDSTSHTICIHAIREQYEITVPPSIIEGACDDLDEPILFRLHDEMYTPRRSHSAQSYHSATNNHPAPRISHDINDTIPHDTSRSPSSAFDTRSRATTYSTLVISTLPTRAISVQSQSRLRSASRSPMSSSLVSSRRTSYSRPRFVSFSSSVTHRAYERVQDGSASIPSQGGHVLGLSWNIAEENVVPLNDEIEDKLTRRYPSSNKAQELKKITERQRLRLLFEQGVALNDDTKDCERIRTSRMEHFCQCEPSEDGQCCVDPEKCVCAQDGVQCHIEHNRYCKCSRWGRKCDNPDGRYEYNESAIFQHSFEILMNGGSETPSQQQRMLSPSFTSKTPRKMSLEDAPYAEDPPDDLILEGSLEPPSSESPRLELSAPLSSSSPRLESSAPMLESESESSPPAALLETSPSPSPSTPVILGVCVEPPLSSSCPTPLSPLESSSPALESASSSESSHTTCETLRVLSVDEPVNDQTGGPYGPSSVGHTPRFHAQLTLHVERTHVTSP